MSLWILKGLMAIYNAYSSIGHQSGGNKVVHFLYELLVIPNNNTFYHCNYVNFSQFVSLKLLLTLQFLIWCLIFFFQIFMSLYTDRACTRLNQAKRKHLEMSKCGWMEVSAGLFHTILDTILQKICGPNGCTLQRLKRITGNCDQEGKQKQN